MKKRISSVICMALVAAVIAVACGNAETAEASEISTSTSNYQVLKTMEAQSNQYGNENISIGELYSLDGPSGMDAMGCEITNISSENLSFNMIIHFWDESYQYIGTATDFIPSLAPGEKAFVYVANGFGDSVYYYAFDWLTETTLVAIPAGDWLGGILQYTGTYDSFRCSATNNTSEVIYEPRVTVVYTLDSVPVAVRSGILSEDQSMFYTIDSGSTGYVDFNYQGNFDDFVIYTTAFTVNNDVLNEDYYYYSY